MSVPMCRLWKEHPSLNRMSCQQSVSRQVLGVQFSVFLFSPLKDPNQTQSNLTVFVHPHESKVWVLICQVPSSYTFTTYRSIYTSYPVDVVKKQRAKTNLQLQPECRRVSMNTVAERRVWSVGDLGWEYPKVSYLLGRYSQSFLSFDKPIDLFQKKGNDVVVPARGIYSTKVRVCPLTALRQVRSLPS